MKKIALICLGCFLLLGCSTSKGENMQPIKMKEKGTISSLTLDDFVEKMKNKETFIVIFSQTTCGYCHEFFLETQAYIEDIGLPMWDVVLDEEERPIQDNLSIIHEYFSTFSATPSIYFVRDGAVVDALEADKKEVNKVEFQKFLKNNNIIK